MLDARFCRSLESPVFQPEIAVAAGMTSAPRGFETIERERLAAELALSSGGPSGQRSGFD